MYIVCMLMYYVYNMYTGRYPEALSLSSNESLCNKEEETSISSSTWKVAILAPILLNDLGFPIFRQAAR